MKKRNKRIIAAILTSAAIGVGFATYFQSALWFWVCVAIAAVLTIIAIIDGRDEFWFLYGLCGGILFVIGFLTGAFNVPVDVTGAIMTGAGFMIPSALGSIVRSL